MQRRRLLFLLLAVLTIGVGLAVHIYGEAVPRAFRDKLGDALWAAMMTWFVAAAIPSAKATTRAAVSIGICFAVELSQLIHTPWLESVRDTTLGSLVLGSGFDAADLAAYAVGVLAVTTLGARMSL